MEPKQSRDPGAEEHAAPADDEGQPDEARLRETREAGMRAEGGGDPDEDDIRAAAEE